jgi:hypothetical protein
MIIELKVMESKSFDAIWKIGKTVWRYEFVLYNHLIGKISIIELA